MTMSRNSLVYALGVAEIWHRGLVTDSHELTPLLGRLSNDKALLTLKEIVDVLVVRGCDPEGRTEGLRLQLILLLLLLTRLVLENGSSLLSTCVIIVTMEQESQATDQLVRRPVMNTQPGSRWNTVEYDDGRRAGVVE